MRINIAIDGPSAAGKSTIAKILAKQLNYIHLDTGAMYRCVGLKAKLNNISFDDEDALADMVKNTKIELTPDSKVYLDGKEVTNDIRKDDISLAASSCSRHAKVRSELVSRQQEMAKDKGYIMDGRDIGTVVLKDAEVKVFMVASAEARAKRRYDQDILLGNHPEDIETIAEEIRQRDYQDTHREVSPLKKASDAIEIDTSDMSIEEVSRAIYDLAKPYLDKEETR